MNWPNLFSRGVPIELPAITISLQSVVTAAVVFLAALVVARLVRRQLGRVRARATETAGPALYLTERFSVIAIVLVGAVVSLSSLGLDLMHLSIFLGALGVGVGLGLQQMVRNFFSGITLLVDRSIEVGDFIELESGVMGEVREVGARATRLVTNDQVDVLVPNGVLLEQRLSNWTRGQTARRVRVPFVVAYGADKELVRKAGLEAARAVPFTRPDEAERKSQVWLVNFGDRGLEFELVVWPTREGVKRPQALFAAYHWAIEDALQRHGLEIPPPQLALRVTDAAARARIEEVPRRLAGG